MLFYDNDTSVLLCCLQNKIYTKINAKNFIWSAINNLRNSAIRGDYFNFNWVVVS